MSISTRELAALPNVTRLAHVLRSYALLDAALCPDWQYRYYSFDRNWAEDEKLGSMRNGEGDHFFALFSSSGCFLKGFDHESPMSPWRHTSKELWPGMLAGIPESFSHCLSEPAFDVPNTTFCIWRETSDRTWNMGDIQFPDANDPDGSEFLLSPLDGRPESCTGWAEDYYERAIDLEAVSDVLHGVALSSALLNRLNPERSLSLMQDDIESIGWPVEA